MSAFDQLNSIPPQLLADGYLARAVHGAQLTLAVVEIEPGAAFPGHQHENEQFGIVIEGSVTFRVGDEQHVEDDPSHVVVLRDVAGWERERQPEGPWDEPDSC